LVRKMALGFGIFLVICVGLYLHFRHPKESLGMAYAGDRGITLYDSSAQIRSPIGSVSYGEPLQIESRFGDQVQVRTSAGLVGWTNNGDLISSDLWQQEKDLNSKTAVGEPEARGTTAVISNLHLDPGRDAPRVRQLKKNVPVELFKREAVAIPQNNSPPASQPESDTGDQSAAANGPKKEDWWLVRAQPDDKSAVSGWMLGRFINLDVPEPLPDYASASNMRIVAWFPLNPATDATGKQVPQYLLVGATGPEGNACDFTMMRIFTWSKKKSQYETAFIDGNVCGKLPINVVRMPVAQTVTMTFTDPTDGSLQTYRMQQTIVRHINPDDGGKIAERRDRR
jgi:hypothetical protein